MKADERNMADSQAIVYMGSLPLYRRFSFSWVVFRAGSVVGGEAGVCSGERGEFSR